MTFFHPDPHEQWRIARAQQRYQLRQRTRKAMIRAQWYRQTQEDHTP
jgi:hypothetical protein